MKYNICVGATIDNKAWFEVELDHEPTDKEVQAMTRERIEDLEFTPEFGLRDFRIVDVQDETGRLIHKQLEL